MQDRVVCPTVAALAMIVHLKCKKNTFSWLLSAIYFHLVVRFYTLYLYTSIQLKLVSSYSKLGNSLWDKELFRQRAGWDLNWSCKKKTWLNIILILTTSNLNSKSILSAIIFLYRFSSLDTGNMATYLLY